MPRQFLQIAKWCASQHFTAPGLTSSQAFPLGLQKILLNRAFENNQVYCATLLSLTWLNLHFRKLHLSGNKF